MKNFISNSFILMLLVLTSLFMANVVATGLENASLTLPIAVCLIVCGFIPLKQEGILSLALNAKNITYAQGAFNPGGVQGRVFYAFEEDIVKWPDALRTIDTATAIEFSELATIPADDPFEFKAGKSFKEIYVTLETGELKYSLIGPRDSKAFQNSMEISFPSNSQEIIGFIAATANRRLVFLVPEQNNRVKVLGTPQFPAQLETVEGTSGKLIEDGNVAVQTYLSKSPIPAPVYLPPIVTEPVGGGGGG